MDIIWLLPWKSQSPAPKPNDSISNLWPFGGARLEVQSRKLVKNTRRVLPISVLFSKLLLFSLRGYEYEWPEKETMNKKTQKHWGPTQLDSLLITTVLSVQRLVYCLIKIVHHFLSCCLAAEHQLNLSNWFDPVFCDRKQTLDFFKFWAFSFYFTTESSNGTLKFLERLKIWKNVGDRIIVLQIMFCTTNVSGRDTIKRKRTRNE